MVTSFLLACESPSRAAQALGEAWGHVEVGEEKQELDFGGNKFQDHKEDGHVIFFCSDTRGRRNTPPPPASRSLNIPKAFEFLQ